MASFMTVRGDAELIHEGSDRPAAADWPTPRGSPYGNDPRHTPGRQSPWVERDLGKDIDFAVPCGYGYTPNAVGGWH